MRMKIGKIIIAGAVTTVVSSILGAVTCGGIFNWVYKLEPTNVWKNMESPPGIGLYVGSLVLHVILAYIYALLQKGIPGKNKIAKGLVFGLCVWAVGTLPAMFSLYYFMTVASAAVIYWTISALITYPILGIIIATIYGE
jgi:hypothetical protein